MAEATIQLTEQQQARMRALYQAHQRDRVFIAHWQDKDAKRNATIQELRTTIHDFASGKTSLEAFISDNQKFASKNDYWGFKGMAGQMQLNIIAKTLVGDIEAHDEVEQSLRIAVTLPPSLEDAVERVNEVTTLLDKLFARHKSRGASGRNVVYILSYFWEAQNRDEYPVCYPNEAAVYEKNIGIASLAKLAGEKYAVYRALIQTLRRLLDAGTWEVEHFGYWLAEQPFIGFAPETFARLQRNVELNGEFISGSGYGDERRAEEAKGNANFAIQQLRDLSNPLRSELGYETYELELTIKPSESRANRTEPTRWRQDAWLSVWQAQRQQRVAVATSPQLQVRVSGDGLYAGYHSGQAPTFAPAEQWEAGPLRDALDKALLLPGVTVYTLRGGENPTPITPDEAAQVDGDTAFLVGLRWAADDPIVGLPSIVGTLAETLRALYPLYQTALTNYTHVGAAVPMAEVEEAESEAAITYDGVETAIAEPVAMYLAGNDAAATFTMPDFDTILNAVDSTLAIDADTVRAVVTHLWAGRHVLLYGPPGVGKTRLARIIAEVICGVGNYSISTANPEWSAYEVVGGIRPQTDGHALSYKYEAGVVSRAVERCSLSLRRAGRPHYLIIDEFNRANLDRAFGELFTALEYPDTLLLAKERGANVDLTIPPQFRMIGTLNSDDRNTLYDIGFALRRRFALVAVGTPPLEQERAKLPVAVQEALRRRAALAELALDPDSSFSDAEMDTTLDVLLNFATVVRSVRPLGTAVLIDTLVFVAAAYLNGTYNNPLVALQDAIIATVLPQLERNPAAVAATLDRAAEYNLPTVVAALERMHGEDASLIG